MICFFKQYGASLYFMLCMIVFLFCSYSGSDNNAFIDIPHIILPTLPLYIVIGITFFFVFFLLLDKESRFDGVAFLLLARLVLHLIPILYMDVPSHFSVNFIISILCLLSYLIFLNFNSDGEKSYFVFYSFLFILSLQVIIEAQIGTESYFGNVYYYKHDLTLPIGASNALASKIVPFLLFCLVTGKRKSMSIIIFVMAFFAVVLTKSRGGLICLLTMIAVISVWQGRFSLELFFKSGVVIPLIFLVAVYFISQTELGGFVFSNSDSSVLGRIDLVHDGIELFNKHPVFGNGFYYFDYAVNPHNWLVDILMRSGFVGFLLMVCIVTFIFFFVKDFLNDRIVRGCLIGIFCMLWQGLVEIVLFSYVHDVMLWGFVGLMMSRVNYLKSIFVVGKNV